MSTNRTNIGPLIGGVALISIGLLTLASQFFRSFNFWGTVWPIFIVGLGVLFFVGMFAGGKPAAGLAVPGSILTAIGLMLFLQNLLGHWESWSYGWTVIVMSVGFGIFLMGWYADNAEQRHSGSRLLKIGAILFVIFGGFFEMIFNSFSFSRFLFPAALILVGAYLVLARSGLLPGRKDTAASETPPDQIDTSPK